MSKHTMFHRVFQMGVVVAATLAIAFLAKHYEYPDIKVNHVEEILVPGMKGEYEFLFLTDLHMAIKTAEDLGPLGNATERINGFSNAKGTVSGNQLPQWISYANKEQVDAVLLGGDILDYYSKENATYLKEQLENLTMPYLFTIGNHDFYSPWKEEIPSDAEIHALFQNQDSAFQVLAYGDFVICAIDNESYQVNEASLIAMKNWMKEHPDTPMILLSHVPFYTEQVVDLKETSVSVWGQPLLVGEGAGDLTTVSREFLKLILDMNSPVVAIISGDNHFYYKGKLTDSVSEWVIDPSFAGNGTIFRVRGN